MKKKIILKNQIMFSKLILCRLVHCRLFKGSYNCFLKSIFDLIFSLYTMMKQPTHLKKHESKKAQN